MNKNRTAGSLQPGDIIFSDEIVWGTMLGEKTPLGQNILIMTDRDTFQLLESELV